MTVEDLRIRLVVSQERLHAAVARLGAAGWSAAPEDGGWSAAEIVAHLIVAESRTLRRLRVGGRASGDATGQESRLEAFMASRETKVAAPEAVQPREVAPDPAAGMAAFDAQRGETLDFLRTPGLALREVGADHPFFGPLDGVQWVLATALHTERHTQQIEELSISES